MLLNRLISDIRNYRYPDDIALTHALDAGPGDRDGLCFLAGYSCREQSFSLYLFRDEGKLMFYFFLDNDESDQPDRFILLSGTMEHYRTALLWIRTTAGENNNQI